MKTRFAGVTHSHWPQMLGATATQVPAGGAGGGGTAPCGGLGGGGGAAAP